jgi:DNA-binding NtrC family response regulator
MHNLKQTILVIDDDINLNQTLAVILQRESYIVATTTNAAQAYRFLRQHECDLIILDFNLPDANGLSLLESLHQLYSQLPVILLSGNPAIDQVVAPLNISLCSCLMKPVDPTHILDCVNEILSNQKYSSPLN